MSDLKPCPFCGGEKIGVAFGIAGCRDCLGQVVRDHNDQATEGWNRRAPSEETGFLEAAKEYCRLMTGDHRNAFSKAERIGRDIDRARGKLYDAYRALRGPRDTGEESA